MVAVAVTAVVDVGVRVSVDVDVSVRVSVGVDVDGSIVIAGVVATEVITTGCGFGGLIIKIITHVPRTSRMSINPAPYHIRLDGISEVAS